MTDQASRGTSLASSARAIARVPEIGLVVGIIVALTVIFFLDRNGSFFSPYSRQTMLHQIALFGILAVGVAVVIISGGIDLSIGAVVALSSVAIETLPPRMFTDPCGVA